MKMVISKMLFVSVISLFLSHVALASESARLTAAVEAHELHERYPLKAIDRPGIMPTYIVQVDTRLKMIGLETVNLNADSTFGIIKNLQGEFGYDGLDFSRAKEKKFEAKPTVNLAAKYNYLSIPHVSFSAKASLPVHLGDGEIIRDVTLGLPVTFYNSIMAFGILNNLLNLAMRGDKQGIKFNFPFWYGVQVYGNFWAQINSNFGNAFYLDGAWAGKPFWKELPLELELSYAFNHHFDLGAHFGFDDVINKPKDSMKFGLVFSIRAGRLFG